MISRIDIEFITEANMRQPGLGDWWMEGDTLRIRSITDDSSEDETFLVALHELVEAWLCRKHGVEQIAVDLYDLAFEERKDRTEDDEPGDEPDAPYREEHRAAMLIEMQMAWFLGLTAYGTVK